MLMFKQVIVIRTDLKMTAGKLSAQVAHASLQAYKNAGAAARAGWEQEGSKKVVLKVPDLESLVEKHREAQRARLPCALITDAGRTEIPAGTVTALAIGPAEEQAVDKVTGMLKML